MKLGTVLLILLGMALSGQLLAPMAMAGCAGIGSAMPTGDGHAMHMAAAATGTHLHHTAPGTDTFGGDCCHAGHSGHCPMASCLTAALPAAVLIDSQRARPAPATEYLSQIRDQHIATHYRPPIFA